MKFLRINNDNVDLFLFCVQYWIVSALLLNKFVHLFYSLLRRRTTPFEIVFFLYTLTPVSHTLTQLHYLFCRTDLIVFLLFNWYYSIVLYYFHLICFFSILGYFMFNCFFFHLHFSLYQRKICVQVFHVRSCEDCKIQ